MSKKTDSFINKIKPSAIETQEKYRIFASITISQAILESGWGCSDLAKKYNNLFGIKALRDWSGQVIHIQTKEWTKNEIVTIKQPFRVYKNWSESIEDHAKFLNKEWYIDAGVFNAKDYKAQINAIVKGGYTSDPNYISKILDLINKYHLTQYDKLACDNAMIEQSEIKNITNRETKVINNEVYGIVTASVLNIRDGASTNSIKIGKLIKGEQVHIFKDYGNWLSIYYGDHGGYISSKYVEMI
ncbi:SH3 domain-containing protein [Clostridium botulinum C]|uniref:N-acetylmuramoyl-L-alanine amidase n=2 Tax=Clostridium botulinum TaxID=1491 RepID=A0A9Q4XUK4_CLOBO|nr:glucosaminidase domain-containing protein [Clostridium botulinum]YP_398538.1 endolysin [Clostridium phage c-st]MCD3194847.1 SH3 domain-containing protein [Clostridium botulinum C]MCD3200218.1 SH3 domain-containing protein [Clostridium botulinum C]MCD3205715.1 SH3 domain-containing protein [Clostridium botulinum C]MCD3207450.1 SH3 domain-containing protein [Clostridium botulinum C]MCD3226184.1 SH3 domain-containing protein [Clostridium botulinum C]